MKINELINILKPLKVSLNGLKGNLNIETISFNSKDTNPSTVFFAYKGEAYDSNKDAEDIYSKGLAKFIVCEKPLGKNIPHMVVVDGRAALAKASDAFFGYPLKSYKSAVVTGTNGKTTTTFILDYIFKDSGATTVLIGTTGIEIAGEHYVTHNTTPSAFDVYKYLKEGKEKDCSYLSMEVSSHALAQGRLAGIKFDVAIFTNLTGDHLDFHKDMEHYFLAKAMLFDDKMSEYKVINIGNEYGKRLAGMIRRKRSLITYSFDGKADIYPIKYENSVNGIDCVLSVFDKTVNIKSHLIGKYNLENIMGALGAALILGEDLEVVVAGIENVENIPGRLEKFMNKGITVFVDFAHTDDALQKVLDVIQIFAHKRIITVFGAGGDRDKTKRPRMGKCACEYSDVVVVTSDNPRFEDENEIIQDILAGIDKNIDKKIMVEPDREKAIAKAIKEAQEGDIVLLAGKGHETYQVIGDKDYPCDDRLLAKKYLGLL